MPVFVSNLAATWASLYANSAVLRTSVGFVHIAGLVASGGAAIVADRATLAAARQDGETRQRQLAAIHQTHRVVVLGLAAVIVSGILLFGSDLDTYLVSRVFWIKMGLLALLMVNGAVLVRAGGRARTGDAQAWRALRYTAGISLALWLLTTLAGAALQNVG